MKLAMRRHLYAARETVELAIVEACLDALHVALHLEHPTLDDFAQHADPPTLTQARSLDRLVRRLRRALAAYRRTVQAAIDNESDSLPF